MSNQEEASIQDRINESLDEIGYQESDGYSDAFWIQPGTFLTPSVRFLYLNAFANFEKGGGFCSNQRYNRAYNGLFTLKKFARLFASIFTSQDDEFNLIAEKFFTALFNEDRIFLIYDHDFSIRNQELAIASEKQQTFSKWDMIYDCPYRCFRMGKTSKDKISFDSILSPSMDIKLDWNRLTMFKWDDMGWYRFYNMFQICTRLNHYEDIFHKMVVLGSNRGYVLSEGVNDFTSQNYITKILNNFNGIVVYRDDAPTGYLMPLELIAPADISLFQEVIDMFLEYQFKFYGLVMGHKDKEERVSVGENIKDVNLPKSYINSVLAGLKASLAVFNKNNQTNLMFFAPGESQMDEQKEGEKFINDDNKEKEDYINVYE